jgi:sugar (pentulose or hexulose) kinase
MSLPCYIGIDVGTSGCRAIAIDAHGAVIAGARQPLPGSSRPRPGWSQQRPEDWWQALTAVLRTIARQLKGRTPTLCLDATSSTLLLADAQGRPLTAGLMYDDRRAGAAAAQVARHAPAESPARGVGSALSKLLHLLDDGAARDAAYALHQADWLCGRLIGRHGLSDENNALKLGYDPVSRLWPDWLDAFPRVRPLLPQVQPVGTPLGALDPSVADLLGLPAATAVVAGTTDSNAATLAATDAGADLRRQDGTLGITSLGSTLVSKVWSDSPVYAARYGVYSHRIAGRWLVGGASNSGGAVLRQHFDNAELDALSAQIDPAIPSPLDYYPLPAPGERFPLCDPALEPRLTPRPDDRVQFLHGILEGIARIEAAGYRCLAELGAPYPTRVLTSGGGADNTTWSAIRARVLELPVERARHQDAAYGAACIARIGARTG